MKNWQHLKILVVDDLQIKHFMISKFLEETKIQITTANNGKIALELFNNEHFNIILMNIFMPEMDGFEATKEIRKFNKDVVIIAQTEYAYLKAKCIQESFSDYIHYPFGKEELIQILKIYI
jgi:CheY-like chemotaxis protein